MLTGKTTPVLLLLLAAVFSSSNAACDIDDTTGNVLCTCGARETLQVPLSSFDNMKHVTIADCAKVNFTGGCSYHNPPTTITFRNITHLSHHRNRDSWPKDTSKSTPISRIEFINIKKIDNLYLNELYPINKVDLLLFRDVKQINTMSNRFDPVYESNVKVLRFENTIIKELMEGSITLKSPQLVSFNKSFIYNWRSKAVNVRNCQTFTVTNHTIVSMMDNNAVVGQFENVVFNRSSFGQVRDRALESMRVTNRFQMIDNKLKVFTPNSFKTSMEVVDDVHVDWVNNSINCEGSFSRTSAHRVCMSVATQYKMLENITCFEEKLNFRDFNNINCSSKSIVDALPNSTYHDSSNSNDETLKWILTEMLSFLIRKINS